MGAHDRVGPPPALGGRGAACAVWPPHWPTTLRGRCVFGRGGLRLRAFEGGPSDRARMTLMNDTSGISICQIGSATVRLYSIWGKWHYGSLAFPTFSGVQVQT